MRQAIPTREEIAERGIATRAMDVEPSSWNPETREVECIFSTGARGWNYIPGAGYALEELDMRPESVRMGTLESGNAPVLDVHSRWSARDVLGRVVSARIEGGRGFARLRFTGADDAAGVVARVADGSLRTVSVGYRTFRHEIIREGELTIYRAVDWEPMEISVAPIPLDSGATMRADRAPSDSPRANTTGVNMTTTAPPAAPGADPAPSAPPSPPVPGQRSDSPSAPLAPAPQPPTVAADAAAIAVQAERDRTVAIGDATRAAAGLIAEESLRELEREALRSGIGAASYRASLFDRAAELARAGAINPARPAGGARSADDPASLINAMGTALALRMSQRFRPDSDVWRGIAARSGIADDGGQHREFFGFAHHPSELFREFLARTGERSIPRRGPELVARAFHTTSDFPLILANAMNKVLLTDYEIAAPAYRVIMQRRTFADFKPHSFIRVGDFPSLLEKGENGEIKAGTISESDETVTAVTYGRRVAVDRRIIVNDDLGAFGDFANMIGRRIADFENATAFAVVNQNSGAGPNLKDGNPVFTTDRGNRAPSGGAIDVASVAAAEARLGERTSSDGLRLDLMPAVLLTGNAYSLTARQLVSTQIVPAQTSNVNPYAGAFQAAKSANVTGNRWYLFADPNVAPVYVYGYVAGFEGPQVRTGQPMGVDGVEVQVLLDFGVGPVDWRGGDFNAGA